MAKKIVVVGVGALGSHLSQFLRNEGDLFLIDFDKVETKNTLSQFHGKTSVGKGKFASLQQTLTFLWGIKTQGSPHKLTSDNVAQLLGSADLVVDCLDNSASRRVVQDYVRAQKIPCLHGALSGDGTLGRAFWDENFMIDTETVTGAPTCEDGGRLPFIALVSSYMALSAQTFLATGRKVSWQVASDSGSMKF